MDERVLMMARVHVLALAAMESAASTPVVIDAPDLTARELELLKGFSPRALAAIARALSRLQPQLGAAATAHTRVSGSRASPCPADAVAGKI